MKLAWVTHRDLNASGGAEAADRDMLTRAPKSVTTIDQLFPGGVDDDVLDDYDRVVVTGLYGYTSRELNALGRHDATFWVHDTQFSGHWFYNVAARVICLSPQHAEYEVMKNSMLKLGDIRVNPGYMELDQFPRPSQVRNGRALWAHRPEAHKGLDLAVAWCQGKGVKLDVMVGQPRSAVLLAMAEAQWFVLLSHIMDPGPRSVIEAQILGCELVVSDNVGHFTEDPEVLKIRVTTAAEQFWRVVMGES